MLFASKARGKPEKSEITGQGGIISGEKTDRRDQKAIEIEGKRTILI